MNKQIIKKTDVKVTGMWDNQPIWRLKTVGERFEEIVKENKNKLPVKKINQK